MYPFQYSQTEIYYFIQNRTFKYKWREITLLTFLAISMFKTSSQPDKSVALHEEYNMRSFTEQA